MQAGPKISAMGLLRAFHVWFKVDVVGGQESKLEKALPWEHPPQTRKPTPGPFSPLEDKAVRTQWGDSRGKTKESASESLPHFTHQEEGERIVSII